ncbi:hypothetical protein JTB14_030952 [Gonioctena quinquepunctata]|nr:hypothetical protein JTB14_030952 [Gonioctena quinquepunctata]
MKLINEDINGYFQCSVTCGKGVQTRSVFCGLSTENGVEEAETEKCDPSKHFETMKNCTGENEQCEGEWFSGPWGKCSKTCGGGERTKKILCVQNDEIVEPTACGSEKIVFSHEDCNSHPCSEDTIMPTDVTHPVDESDISTVTIRSTELSEATESSTESLSTDSSKATTAPPATEKPTGDTEEYEIVPATNCDDGEWVEVEVPPEDMEQNDAPMNEIEINEEIPFMLDDLMMNDEPVIVEEVEGSGGAPTDISSSTLEEGSGSESSIITEESPETVSTISGATEKNTLPILTITEEAEYINESEVGARKVTTTSTASSKEPSEATTDEVESTTEFTGSTEESESTVEFTGSTMETQTTTEVDDTSASGSTHTAISSEDPVSTSQYSGSTESDTTESGITTETGSTSGSDITDGVSESSGSTVEFSGSTEISSSSGSTEIPESTTQFTGTTTEYTGSTTEFTGSTEGPRSSSSESTDENSGSTSEVTGSTEISSAASSLSESSTTNARTESTEAFTETTTDNAGSTSEAMGSSEISSSASSSPEGSTEGYTSSIGTPCEQLIGGKYDSIHWNYDRIYREYERSSRSKCTATTNQQKSKPETESTEAFTGSTTENTGSTSEIIGSTEMSSSSSSEISTTELSGSTTEFTGTTIEFTGSTEISSIASSTTEFAESTTEFTGSTTESTGSTTEFTGSTEISSSARSSPESSTTALTGSTGEYTGSTTEFTGSTTDFTGSTTEFTGSTTEFTGSTTEFTGSTDISSSSESAGTDIFSTTESGMTEESTYFSLYGTTPITDIFKKTQKMCKRRKNKACRKTEYGCCWDNITPAKGPFDSGCPTPHTCKESKFGCCEDGVSPALGTKFAGCPSSHCDETLFGCCPDNKTIAEGNDDEGCPPLCLSTEYGCCNDNITEATGPDHGGCEEAETTTFTSVSESVSTEVTTESTESSMSTESTVSSTTETTTELVEDCNDAAYRCCPDGVTPALGPGFQGCNLPCSNSTFGCCPDAQTSAHGPTGEGCCLSTEFGCCPDNIVPARGPNHQGCECELSPYGCCPDNKTSAQGYNSEGCGCQFTPFGCCPDNVDTALGPDFRGCLCHTFQFGCCPDGVTVAKGPQEQGCGCRNSEYGCCSDEKTAATGPNMEGCSCDNSKFGCCTDGVTEAKGDNFEGCESSPQNLQAACSVPKQKGNCRDFKVKWFFDMDYGGCSRFWYGGCDGNGNRFNTKEECESICVKPQGTDRCGLPKVVGQCEGYYPIWYYDKDLKNCAQFVYGGCLGNNNRFETREECMGLCVKDNSADVCDQVKEEGPCQGQYRRYYFDKEAGQCTAFRYGGCKGNNNNFPTIEACNQKCNAQGLKKDHCSLPKMEGNCTEHLPRWYFDTPENRCVPFYYTGCEGNQNSFETKAACENECPRVIEKDICQLPAEIGQCANYVGRWYFDTTEKTCRQFYYGGCEGNGNNFASNEDCQRRCGNLPPVEPKPQTQPPQPTSGPSETFKTEMCFLPSETGLCKAAFTKYFYDSSDGICKTFVYGGCRGNRNNFKTHEECIQYCGNAQDFCTLPPVAGPCNDSYIQYYYDESSRSCHPFNFGGCGGNYNRFQDKESCERQCKPTSAPGTQAPPVDMCQNPADSGNCSENYVAFFYDKDTGRCTPFTYTGCGGNDNRFNSEEQCERQCGDFRGQDNCNMERDPGPCNGYFVKYFYNKNSGRCEQFAYGGCQGNGNRFSSGEECEHICVTHQETKPNITNTVPPVLATGTPPPPSCHEVFNECTTLRCPYGVEPYVDENECNRCRCRDPCMGVECLEDEQCAIDINRNKTSPEDADFIAICRKRVKPGSCPNLVMENIDCVEECRTDADCTLHLKCCSTGCGNACVDPPPPAQLVTQQPEPAFTDGSAIVPVQPPKVDPIEFKPQISAALGDQAILRCAVSGNPNPRISWSKDNIEIDGTQARYRIKLDQSLQIITLHKTDSGIYLCTADNGIGDPIANEIKLDVVDTGPRPPTMLEGVEEEPPLIVSLNAPTSLNCFVLGNPFPTVTWWKGTSMIPFANSEFEIRQDNSLLIHSVKLHNLGIYTCQAYNGYGKAASWSVVVKARGPYLFTNPGEYKYRQYIVDSPDEPTPSTTASSTTSTTPIPPLPSRYPPYIPPQVSYPPFPLFTEPSNEIIPGTWPDAAGEMEPTSIIVPVRANITMNDRKYPVGSDIDIPCSVTGFPTPQVRWYKDGVPLSPSEKIQISDSNTLSILQATKADSGFYQCEAYNVYTKSTSTLEILVKGVYIHPNCTDNPFFANCALIVKAKFCSHKYYGRYCCRSCTEAGLLSTDVSQTFHEQYALDNNLV